MLSGKTKAMAGALRYDPKVDKHHLDRHAYSVPRVLKSHYLDDLHEFMETNSSVATPFSPHEGLVGLDFTQ